MIEGVRSEGEDHPSKRIQLDQSVIREKRLRDFVTRNTRKFFEILSIPDSFLEVDPGSWETNPDYLQAEDIVRALRVVNDTAE